MKILTRSLLAVALVLIAQTAMAQTDFDEYVQQIRESGMTEGAASAIQTAASLASRASILEAKLSPDGKSLGRSYTSAYCPKPGADPETVRAAREKTAAKMKVWVDFFKKAADTDGSGFVSTHEGWALRERVELGILAPQVEDVDSVDGLVELLHQDRAQVVEELAAYAKLREGAAKEGLEGMPEVPEYLRGAIRAM
jgi:hypothetical protein